MRIKNKARHSPLSISLGWQAAFYEVPGAGYPGIKRVQNDETTPTEYAKYFMFESGFSRPASDFVRLYLAVYMKLLRRWDYVAYDPVEAECDIALVTEPFMQNAITWANQPTSLVHVASGGTDGYPYSFIGYGPYLQYFVGLQDLGYPVYGVVAKGNVTQTAGPPYDPIFLDNCGQFNGVLIE